MWPDLVSNPGHLPLQSDALSTALRVCVRVCEREREREKGCLYSYVSDGKCYFENNDSQFVPGTKTTTCTWKSFHTFRGTKQTFIPTYMHQKILSCNIKLDSIGENASKICCLPREDAFWLLD